MNTLSALDTIAVVSNMTKFEKLSVYMNYFVNKITYEYAYKKPFDDFGHPAYKHVDFDKFISQSNIREHTPPPDRGFASEYWVTFSPESVYYYVYHDLG